MAKNFNPFVLLMIPEPSPTTVVGGGTGQSTTDPYACSFADWQNLFASDVNGDGQTNFDDYRQWFINTFGDEAAELWEMFNDDPLYPSIQPDPGFEPIIDPTETPFIEP